MLIIDSCQPIDDMNAMKCALKQALLVLVSGVYILSARAGVTGARGVSPGATSWQVLLPANLPATPVTLVDTNFRGPVRFHRIQIGP